MIPGATRSDWQRARAQLAILRKHSPNRDRALARYITRLLVRLVVVGRQS